MSFHPIACTAVNAKAEIGAALCAASGCLASGSIRQDAGFELCGTIEIIFARFTGRNGANGVVALRIIIGVV